MDARISTSPNTAPKWRVLALMAILACAPRLECSNAQDTNTTSIKTPIQILPSRFPPPIEKWIERIQNYFSTYNHPDLQNRPYTPQTSPPLSSTETPTSPDPPVGEEEFVTELVAEIITTTDGEDITEDSL